MATSQLFLLSLRGEGLDTQHLLSEVGVEHITVSWDFVGEPITVSVEERTHCSTGINSSNNSSGGVRRSESSILTLRIMLQVKINVSIYIETRHGVKIFKKSVLGMRILTGKLTRPPFRAKKKYSQI